MRSFPVRDVFNMIFTSLRITTSFFFTSCSCGTFFFFSCCNSFWVISCCFKTSLSFSKVVCTYFIIKCLVRKAVKILIILTTILLATLWTRKTCCNTVLPFEICISIHQFEVCNHFFVFFLCKPTTFGNSDTTCTHQELVNVLIVLNKCDVNWLCKFVLNFLLELDRCHSIWTLVFAKFYIYLILFKPFSCAFLAFRTSIFIKNIIFI